MKSRDTASAPPFPAEAASLLLPGAAGAIEIAVSVPAQDARNGVAVIAHPHPLQGGTMFNKVVTTLDRALGELGLATVRFNFRGVGRSEGVHDEGRGETDDLAAVAEWVRREKPGAALWLAGFSFGSYVALRAAARLAPQQLVLVAPPVGRWDFSGIEWPQCPVLIVQGGDDDIVDPAAVAEWAAQQTPASGDLIIVTASIGIVEWSPRYATVADLMRDADRQLYRAKALGRNRVCTALEESDL